MDINSIINKLKNVLDSYRFNHSVNVMRIAESLAKHYEIDTYKARLAGILHDCGKNYKGNEAREYVKTIDYEADEVEILQPKLLHGIIGENLAKVVYGVTDKEILGAIRWHTTGKAGMSILEKIIYVADYIEPLRSFEGVEIMRKVAYEDLDKCIVFCADSTINIILKKGALLHKNTVETRNHSLMLIKSRSAKYL
ncbi:MAG: bis(5'-nucleosyl)-tetraphosphatase (symmetrical) YqeK [Acetivibrionales bacterium]|jgi:predicted HD superfamily hydrolase involved in NAD metabolism